MDILSLFITVPVITILVLVFTKGLKQARLVAMVGSIIQFGMAINLVFAYFKERAVNDDIMVFTKDVVWFEQFNIHYSIGVDGISVALLVLLTINCGTCWSFHILENERFTQRIFLFHLLYYQSVYTASLFLLICS